MCQKGSDGNPSLKSKDETEREEQDGRQVKLYFR